MCRLFRTLAVLSAITIACGCGGGGGSSGPQPASIAAIPAPLVTQQPPATAEQSAPPLPQSGPAHVTTWLYYGLNGVNKAIPASYMASKATFVETNAGEGPAGKNFKNAGGQYAVNYSDPGLASGCAPPFTAPAGACTGQLANLGLPESAFLHAPDGSRLYVAAFGAYQEIFNPASPDAQAGYAAVTRQDLAISNLDYFFADDSGGPYDGVDGTPASGLLASFSQHHSIEFPDGADQQWIAARGQMFAAALRPVFVNGYSYANWLPSYGGAYLSLANVVGENNESCFNSNLNGLLSDASGYWRNMANSLLAVTAMHKYAVCMMLGQNTPSNRLYAYASWLMTYDPVYSIAAPVVPAADGFAVFPEYEIVPAAPLATAAGDVSVLRSGPGGPYVREFAGCYQGGVSIGGCAVVVNTTAGALALPGLSGNYAHALTLDARSSYTGGQAAWSNGVPASVPAIAALVLAR